HAARQTRDHRPPRERARRIGTDPLRPAELAAREQDLAAVPRRLAETHNAGLEERAHADHGRRLACGTREQRRGRDRRERRGPQCRTLEPRDEKYSMSTGKYERSMGISSAGTRASRSAAV